MSSQQPCYKSPPPPSASAFPDGYALYNSLLYHRQDSSLPSHTTVKMTEVAALGPQPNPQRIQQSLQALIEESDKISNVPAFTTGTAILQALERIEKKIDAVERRLNGKIDRLDSRLTANDYNGAARVQNAFLGANTQELSPLVNPSTNTAIEGFPATSGHIPSMTPAALNSLLRELGLSTDGRRPDKEKRLRHYIGLRGAPA